MKNILSFFTLLTLSLVSGAGFCSAATIFTDDFNSYPINTSLNGKGGWTASTATVINSPVNEGSAAVKLTGGAGSAFVVKSGSLTQDGKITVYVRRHIGGTTNPLFDISLFEGANSRITLKSNSLSFRYWNGSGFVNFGPKFSPDIWFSVQIQWRSSDHKARYRINGEAWTDWFSTVSSWVSGIDKIKLTGVDGVTYFDTIQENLIGEKNPVLIMPGILGSAQKDGVWVIDPILHTYDNLIDGFEANGYVENETLFTFPYDWHQSNVDTAPDLKSKIDDIKEICDCQKVDIVGHSMGGLVARQYIQSGAYEDDVDQLIFLGTPHLGAPKDYLAWEGGEADKGLMDQIMKFMLSREAEKLGYDNTFEYIRNKPILSIQELLPVYNYLVDSNPLGVRHYPDNYPTNQFLENLNNNISTLNNSGVGIYNIIGDSQDNSTISFIRVVPSDKLPLWEHGYPEGFDENEGDRGLSLGEGDGTVPNESANIFENTTLLSSDHIGLPTNAQSETFDLLLGEGDHNTVSDFNLLNLKILIIKLLSPVDMHVVAPDGKIIGKDFNTGQEINEIPYAFYSGFNTDNEYITIINPEDGEYELVVQGTDNGGEYTISSALISDDQTLEQDFTAHIATNQIENINLGLSSTAGDIVITPEDATPPQITINSPENKDYLHSDILDIDYSVSDEDSGVFSSKALLDTIEVENGQAVDLFFKPLGNHNFEVKTEDNVNNEASELVKFRIIATVESTIYDINRAYELGWINKSVKNHLINLVDKATRIIKKVNKKLDVFLGKAILLNLKVFQKNGLINQQAYNLLSEDVNWLINN